MVVGAFIKNVGTSTSSLKKYYTAVEITMMWYSCWNRQAAQWRMLGSPSVNP
jgi:hypothetical protein